MGAFVIDTLSGPVAFAAIPKCGQHTIAAYGGVMVDSAVIHKIATRIAFIRDPFDRLKSAFHFFKQTNCYVQCDHMSSYGKFIDWALDSDDEHVIPQHKFLFNSFNTLIKIEYMSEVMEELTGSVVTPQNTSEHNMKCDADYRADDIKSYYKEDYELYEEALNGLH